MQPQDNYSEAHAGQESVKCLYIIICIYATSTTVRPGKLTETTMVQTRADQLLSDHTLWAAPVVATCHGGCISTGHRIPRHSPTAPDMWVFPPTLHCSRHIGISPCCTRHIRAPASLLHCVCGSWVQVPQLHLQLPGHGFLCCSRELHQHPLPCAWHCEVRLKAEVK